MRLRCLRQSSKGFSQLLSPPRRPNAPPSEPPDATDMHHQPCIAADPHTSLYRLRCVLRHRVLYFNKDYICRASTKIMSLVAPGRPPRPEHTAESSAGVAHPRPPIPPAPHRSAAQDVSKKMTSRLDDEYDPIAVSGRWALWVDGVMGVHVGDCALPGFRAVGVLMHLFIRQAQGQAWSGRVTPSPSEPELLEFPSFG